MPQPAKGRFGRLCRPNLPHPPTQKKMNLSFRNVARKLLPAWFAIRTIKAQITTNGQRPKGDKSALTEGKKSAFEKGIYQSKKNTFNMLFVGRHIILKKTAIKHKLSSQILQININLTLQQLIICTLNIAMCKSQLFLHTKL